MVKNPRDALAVSQGHQTVPFHIIKYRFLLCNSNYVFKMHHFSDILLKKCCDLEIWGRGHSRSLKVVSFDRLCMISY